MPYLDAKIEKHRIDCINPVGKRLYIRDYNEKGKQCFVPYALTCTTCGIVVKEMYKRNLTPKELKYREIDRKMEGTEIGKSFDQLEGGVRLSEEEKFQNLQRYKIREKLKRLKRKKLGPEAISPQENGLRSRVKGLKNFYETATYYWSISSDSKYYNFGWDNKLVDEFLNLCPRPSVSELLKVFRPSGSLISVDSQRKYSRRGYVPNPEKPGWLKYDKDQYLELLKTEAEKRRQVMQEIIKGRMKKHDGTIPAWRD